MLVALAQARHEAAIAEAQTAAAAAMAREQRTVAAREQEIADLTLALAGRTAEVEYLLVIIALVCLCAPS
jgi:cytochrome c biogenesis protein ResB